jgi:hypothetical protein
LELKSRGPVTATNGKILPDGSVRWDLSFARPAKIALTSGPLNVQIRAAIPSVSVGQPDRNDPTTPPAPAGADWSAVYASGSYYGPSPLGAWQNIGESGTYDFMRWGGTTGVHNSYRAAAKFAGGVYSSGAGIPESVLDAAMSLLPDLRT